MARSDSVCPVVSVWRVVSVFAAYAKLTGHVGAYVKPIVVGVGPAYAEFNTSSRQAQDPT